jgi:hypothetical protein
VAKTIVKTSDADLLNHAKKLVVVAKATSPNCRSRRGSVGFGSLASFLAGSSDVCSSPDSGAIADVLQPLLGA